MLKLSLVLIILCILSVGCKSHHSEDHVNHVKVDDLAPDFKVPQDLFREIEKKLAAESKAEPVFIFIPLVVKLMSDQEGVVKNGINEIQYPNGGGRLDLKDYLDQSGTFTLSFPEDQFKDRPEIEFLFYLSDAPKQKFDSDEYGLGCGKWVDLKAKFKDLQKKDFLKVNNSDLRYLHVLSGQYIFVFRKGNQFSLSHLNVTDSRYESKLCHSIFPLQSK